MKNSDAVLNYLFTHPNTGTATIAKDLEINQRTTQRAISSLLEEGKIISSGNGKNTLYSIANKYRVLGDFGESELLDTRLETEVPIQFDFDIFDILNQESIFTTEEAQMLSELITKHSINLESIDQAIQKREIERLVVEFSWKSSKIEGNTYSLLETDKLLSNNITSEKHTTAETQMVLNHKAALDFVMTNPEYFQSQITTQKIIEVHSLLTQNLEINKNYRTSQVGITGSLYKPLGDIHQIREAMDKLIVLLSKKTPLEQALLVTLFISYIQPFSDGNKRTARLVSNAILFAHNLPLLSYRNTSIDDYKTATITFYERHNISQFKQIFISQLQYFVQYYF